MWPVYIAVGVAVIPIIIAGPVKNKIAKSLLSALCLLGMFVSSVLLSGFVLPNFLGADGIWFGFVFCGAAFVLGMLFVWKPFKPKLRRAVSLSVAGTLILTAAVVLVPKINRQSLSIPGEDITLRRYMPFGDSDSDDPSATLVKMLDKKSALTFEDNLPRLDGATALYPLYSAFVRAVYPKDEYFPYYDLGAEDEEYKTAVACSTTSYAFENLTEGRADIVFLMGVSGEQKAMTEAKGLELSLTPIGREAFIFFVNSRNPVSNLSTDDIKKIYSGQVTNWREVGGRDDGILAYQRPDESGSQTMLKYILDGSPLMPAPEEDIYDFMLGMYQRVAGYLNYKNSLGYSFLFYIRDMIAENKVRFLSIDGIAPERENIENGSYPFANDFYAVTVKRGGEYLNPERSENIDKFLDWVQSPEGQSLVDATGYVPVG